MTLQDHMIKGSCDFMGRSSTCNHPTKFGDRSHCGSGEITYLISQVILQDHVIEGYCDFTDGSFS